MSLAQTIARPVFLHVPDPTKVVLLVVMGCLRDRYGQLTDRIAVHLRAANVMMRTPPLNSNTRLHFLANFILTVHSMGMGIISRYKSVAILNAMTMVTITTDSPA